MRTKISQNCEPILSLLPKNSRSLIYYPKIILIEKVKLLKKKCQKIICIYAR